MDSNLTLSERNLAGLGALTQRLLGNNSLFPSDNNTTVSKAEEEDLEVNTDVYSKVVVTVIYVALFAVGSLGNSITLYTLLTKKTLQNLQSTVHYHLASLAVSDLLILVLSMPIELYNFIWFHHPWVFGDAVCRGYYFLRDSCSYATALNIASLSVERYMAICHPFKAKSIMSRSRTKKLISAMWIASFALATPMLFVMGQVMRKGEKICTAIVSSVTIKTVLQILQTPGSWARGEEEKDVMALQGLSTEELILKLLEGGIELTEEEAQKFRVWNLLATHCLQSFPFQNSHKMSRSA